MAAPRSLMEGTGNGTCFTCNHPQSLHFKDRGSCMHSTEALTWACDCLEYVPKIA